MQPDYSAAVPSYLVPTDRLGYLIQLELITPVNLIQISRSIVYSNLAMEVTLLFINTDIIY